jgi:hypothetical protein
VPIPAELLQSIKGTLVAGGYSLLLGAGASCDSKSTKGDLPLGDRLRAELVALRKLRPNSSLARAYSSLSQAEIEYVHNRPFRRLHSRAEAYLKSQSSTGDESTR